jgi:hypothetical protein
VTHPEFTPVELEIADLAGRGYGHWRIAIALKRRPGGVRQAIIAIANRLPNPDSLPPLTLVQLWGAHRRWLREHHPSTPGRAA